MSERPKFIFTTCQLGAENALKEEVAELGLGLKFAFSRPGFITFKADPLVPVPEDLELVFARSYGVSLGRAKGSPEEIAIAALGYARALAGPLHLHVFERDQFAVGEELPDYNPRFAADLIEQAVRRLAKENPAAAGIFRRSDEALSIGDRVLDITWVDEGEGWFGSHVHSRAHRPWAGGKFPGVLPEEAPSRAYLKLEEALAWSEVPIARGDIALEIGSAPGGASYLLLQRGLSVAGIDPGEMAPVVLNHPQFHHYRKIFAEIFAGDLPEGVRWIVCDINSIPNVSLPAVDGFVAKTRDSLLGVLVTLKLNEWEFARSIPWMLEYLERMGMVEVRAAQLSTNKQEFFAYGLTPMGLARKKS